MLSLHGISVHSMSAPAMPAQTFLDRKLVFTQTGKTTAIRRIVVRETSVSRYQGGPIKCPLKPSGISYHYRIEGVKRAHKS